MVYKHLLGQPIFKGVGLQKKTYVLYDIGKNTNSFLSIQINKSILLRGQKGKYNVEFIICGHLLSFTFGYLNLFIYFWRKIQISCF